MSENTEKKNSSQVWKMILLPIVLALIPLLYPEIKDLLGRKQPQFILDDPVVKKGDDVIYIFAENNAAQKKTNLNIEIGGLEIKDAGKLVRENPLKWEFEFQKYDLPRAILGEGLNTISVSFAGGQSSPEMNFYINADFFQDAVVIAPVPKGDVIRSNSVETEVIEEPDSAPIVSDNRAAMVKIVSTTSDDDPLVETSMNTLREKGINNVVGYKNRVEHTGKNFRSSEVRYFTEADKAKAEQVQKVLKKDGVESKLVDYSKKLGRDKRIIENTKGQVEVWLGRNKGVNLK